jgi:HSP20 family protein
MPRYSGKKPHHHEILSRQVGEIKSLLHVLEMRDEMDESDSRPRMDMYESETDIVLEFDLPGFRMENICLKVAGTTLTLDAHKPREQVEGRFICMERVFGHFQYIVQIPGSVNVCAINAEYRLGVLRVKCPKTSGLQIPIKEITVE